METAARISHTSALILQTIRSGYIYGFDIMTLPVCRAAHYPALRRLENESLLRGDWETARSLCARTARASLLQAHASGQDALISAVERYPLLARLAPEEKVARR